MLHDVSSHGTTKLSVVDRETNQPLPQYEISGDSRRRLLLMASGLRVRIVMGEAATFDVRWEFDVQEETQRPVRRELASLYCRLHRPHKPVLPDTPLREDVQIHRCRTMKRHRYWTISEAVDIATGKVYAVRSVFVPLSESARLQELRAAVRSRLSQEARTTHVSGFAWSLHWTGKADLIR